MKSFTVSIALATYNGEEHLLEQLNSYIGQTRCPDEVVICDDGSTDRTLAIVSDFAQRSPFSVRIVRNEANLGYTQNFAKALTLCSGDVIFPSDQDDVWFPEKIQRTLALLSENPQCWLLIHDGKFTDANGNPTGLTKMGQVRSGYGPSDFIVTGALSVIRREFLAAALPIPEGIVGHDIWLHKLCSLFDGRRLKVDDCLQTIRRHSSNTSEWVVNSNRKISPIDVLKAQMSTRPAVNYRDRIELNNRLRERITALTLADSRSAWRDLNVGALGRLEREFTALKARESLIERGPVGRRIKAVSMLFNGDYKEFNGWRSFLRDFVR